MENLDRTTKFHYVFLAPYLVVTLFSSHSSLKKIYINKKKKTCIQILKNSQAKLNIVHKPVDDCQLLTIRPTFQSEICPILQMGKGHLIEKEAICRKI